MAPKFVEWSLNPLNPPWGNAPSLYIHIRDNPNLSDLPDEKREAGKIRFAPGAWDGVMSHHMMSGESPSIAERADKVEQLLENLLRISSDENLRALYNAVIAEQMYPLGDELINRAVKRIPRVQPELAAIGRYFAVGADHREATKFGILLLAAAGDKSDIRTLETLARHDEFTLFAAVACTKLVDDPEQCLWRLAQNVHGWGRIQLVERLDGTANPEIQDWMLREGFRNSVMNNYLAEICARTGKLDEALQQPAIDASLLDSSADLLTAILEGGPSAAMDDYEQAPQALAGYFDHLEEVSNPRLDHFLTVSQILEFLNHESRWQGELGPGWSLRLRDELRGRCKVILARDSWLPQAQEELASEDRYRFHIADMVARKLGQNTWEQHFQAVHKDPMGAGWFHLMQLTDNSNIDRVLDFAMSALPLDKIAGDPENTPGFGPEFEAETALDWILQDLGRFPKRGWPLIKAGLQSRVTRNRRFALKALLAWPREEWPAEAFPILQHARRQEPNEELRQSLADAVKVN